jgi:hypothetical protein
LAKLQMPSTHPFVSPCCLARRQFWPQPFSVARLCNSSVCKFSAVPILN